VIPNFAINRSSMKDSRVRQFCIDRIALSPNNVPPCRSAPPPGVRNTRATNFSDDFSSVSCQTPSSAHRQKSIGDFAIGMNGETLEVHNSCSTGWIFFPNFQGK